MAENTLHKAPPRMSLTNVETGDYITAQFNPEEIHERLGVNFNELDAAGWSQRPLQYHNTGNLEIKFDLGFDAQSTRLIETNRDRITSAVSGEQAIPHIAYARRFLESLCYPQSSAPGDILHAGTPRVLLSWPRLFALVVRIKDIDLTHKRFDTNTGASSWFTASLTLVEAARKTRLTSQQVLDYGTLRSDR